jgi:hypothetical protein
MITELPLGYNVEVDGFTFILGSICIRVEDDRGGVVAYIPVLNSDGIRIVRTQEQFETEVAFWLGEYR